MGSSGSNWFGFVGNDRNNAMHAIATGPTE
jgi:hypothetical protein